MNLNSEIFRQIRLQEWRYKTINHKWPTAIIIHPDVCFGEAIVIGSNGSTLLRMEIHLSVNIEPNEFIIGEKFKVEE